ncbi:hypothetical protein Tco_0773926 [Tanacetum coccineum]|uniref:Retrovirus-related Pol polyprotein from transposon TNT 1-94-like beta-barrel domain-containing protein n=1 Tax=Tanacetum coccineum TaxID=301880 RepID=A0ABQ4ZM53_9ASTR
MTISSGLSTSLTGVLGGRNSISSKHIESSYREAVRTQMRIPHKGVKASANSDVMYFFTSAQDGDPSQDDVRLCLGDDLKKAQDHITTAERYNFYTNGVKDAKKKELKTILQQMYENFNDPSIESLDSIFNRLQKIVSQLAILENKPDLDTMSFDDLYNNFKIVEARFKRTANSSSSSSSQNMAFMSSPSSTNEVNTANIQVSHASTQVSTASTQVSTANLSDATVYAFLANQPNDIAEHEDKKVFPEDWECRGSRKQDSRNWNQDSSKRTINVEDTSSKAMLAIDGAGHPQKEDQGYVDSGCSRHITWNMSYLSDFKEFDGGYVTFGGGAKGGKITRKGTLGKLDFEDVYFVKEIQFNLFSVSQMCEHKNR